MIIKNKFDLRKWFANLNRGYKSPSKYKQTLKERRRERLSKYPGRLIMRLDNAKNS